MVGIRAFGAAVAVGWMPILRFMLGDIMCAVVDDRPSSEARGRLPRVAMLATERVCRARVFAHCS